MPSEGQGLVVIGKFIVLVLVLLVLLLGIIGVAASGCVLG